MEKAKIGTTKSSEDDKTIVTNQICSFAKLDKNSELSIWRSPVETNAVVMKQ